MTSYYANGKKGLPDGARIWRPKWYGELGNDAEFREAVKPRPPSMGYYQGGHRLTIGGVPIRLAAHVKDWPARAKSALGKGTASWKETRALEEQAAKLGLCKPASELFAEADFSCTHCRRVFNFYRTNAYDDHGCAFAQEAA